MLSRYLTMPLISVLFLMVGASAAAAPIQYRYTGMAQGSLDGVTFGYSAFELTLNGDTDGVWEWSLSEPGFPVYQNLVLPGQAQIAIEGIGLITFTQALLMSAQSGDPYWWCPDCIGVVDPKDGSTIYVWLAAEPSLVGYDLAHDVPETVVSSYGSNFGYSPLLTDAGNLFVSVDATSFSATLVPLPAAAWMFGSAIGLLGWFNRRRANAS